MIVKKALIIDSPWIEKILAGNKVWEMRSTRASHRGPFGLIQKGSGQVKGIATLHSVSGPYNNEELAEHYSLHHVGPDLYERPDYKWRYAWELSSAIALPSPVSYRHKNGAVTWVDLDEPVVQDIARQLGSQATDQATPSQPHENHAATYAPALSPAGLQVPIARDGTVFSYKCGRRGTYTVGGKGDECRFNNFHEALTFLKSMPTAKWRRPNSNGNWGIVSAVDWVDLDKYEANA